MVFKEVKKVEGKFYTIKEASKILGLTEQVIRNYIYLGKIEATKILNSTAISKEEMDRQLEARKPMK